MQTTAPPALHLDRETLLNLDRSLSREWLETDGLGSYASSTVVCCPTRRYHGLLVGYPPGSSKRHNFLSRFEESFHGGGKQFSISISRYPGLFHPLGHQGIERFDLAPWPAWVYQFGSARLERDVLMVKGQPTVLVRYRVSGQRNPVEMRLRPLLPMREADALTFENDAVKKPVTRQGNGIHCQPYEGVPGISITISSDAQFVQDPCWFRQQEYRTDIARGYEGREDNYSPGTFHVALQSGVDVIVAASIDGVVEDPAGLWERESRRRLEEQGLHAGVRGALENSARDFLYRAPGGRLGVIAGYPWFGEWGRDTFISRAV
jgi:predicted glycogen debranching enzyme